MRRMQEGSGEALGQGHSCRMKEGGSWGAQGQGHSCRMKEGGSLEALGQGHSCRMKEGGSWGAQGQGRSCHMKEGGSWEALGLACSRHREQDAWVQVQGHRLEEEWEQPARANMTMCSSMTFRTGPASTVKVAGWAAGQLVQWQYIIIYYYDILLL